LQSIKDVLRQELPKIGLKNFAIFLYNGKEGADLFFMHDHKGSTREEADKKSDNVVKSLYQHHRDDEQAYACVLMALYFKKEVLGCAIFDLIPLEGSIYESLSIQISGALMGARLINELEATQHEIIITLGNLVETRSHETGNHVRRVAEYSQLLGQAYGLPPIECDLLCQAAPLHDIGKVGIEDYILYKPGVLTPKEWDCMKTHTTIGYNLLKKSERPILKAAATIAYQHHERYDGAGYPRGLKGENIDIFGRIVCLADVFDALTTDRDYKKKWPLRKTINYIKSERGRLFDPVLVDIFLIHLKEFLVIKRKLADKLNKKQ
jgi:HD-GYP domain-containing protein (c-di-GMP phosphodiesterase class II)